MKFLMVAIPSEQATSRPIWSMPLYPPEMTYSFGLADGVRQASEPLVDHGT